MNYFRFFVFIPGQFIVRENFSQNLDGIVKDVELVAQNIFRDRVF